MTFRFELLQRPPNRKKNKSVQAVETIAFQILYSSVDIVPQHENITEPKWTTLRVSRENIHYTHTHAPEHTQLSVLRQDCVARRGGTHGPPVNCLIWVKLALSGDFRISGAPFASY